ncbi:Mth938-like domain-containing protein [Arenicellales bacterium IMCC55707]
MELTQEINSDRPMIQSYDASGVTISGTLFAESFILMPQDTFPQIWAVKKFQDISTDVLDAFFSAPWDALLLGTGSEHQLPGPDLLKLMAQRNRTIDFMSSRAACATFNLLSMDHREVAAAIILPLEN